MNRVELKNKAKDMIKGNKWYILKPLVIFALCAFAVSFVAVLLDSVLGLDKTEVVELAEGIKTTNHSGVISSIAGMVVGVASSVFMVGYAMYILSFIRGKKLEMKDIIEFSKKHWLVAFLTSLIAGLIITGCTILLVIPGVIAAIGLMFYQEVCADNPEMKAWDIIKKSWNMTKGHKMDLFVLGLSFIGWCIVACLTFGILYIWLYPYMTVTMTLAYEELKKAA